MYLHKLLATSAPLSDQRNEQDKGQFRPRKGSGAMTEHATIPAKKRTAAGTVLADASGRGPRWLRLGRGDRLGRADGKD